MPNIREFDTPQLGLRPNDSGTDATVQSGRRIASYYRDAGDSMTETGNRAASAVRDVGNAVVKQVEHQEISKGAAVTASALSGLDDLWNKTAKAADPSDPSVRAKFMEESVEPQLEKLRNGFLTEGGQKFAESQIESIRNHFVTKTAADMSSLAAIAVKTNYATTVNTLSNAVRSDPSSLPTALNTVDASVSALADSSPNLDAVSNARVKGELSLSAKTEIVKSAAIGAIAINPEAGLKKFSAPEYAKYISGSELQQLTQQAKAVQRAERVDQTYQRTLEKQERQDASDAAEGAYLEKLHSGDPKIAATVSAKTIASDWTLTREARERMILIVERATKPETDAKVSRDTTVKLFNWMRTQDNSDPIKLKNKVDDEYAAGNLTWTDRTNLIKEVEDRKTPEGLALAQDRAQFFKQYTGAIADGVIDENGKRVVYDPVMGSPKLYAAERDARRIEQDLKSKGLDPHLAYDPSSQYFLGKPATIQKWRGSMQADLQTRAETPNAPAKITSKDDLTLPPAPLRGIADLQWSAKRQQYRDGVTGKLYNRDGTEVQQ